MITILLSALLFYLFPLSVGTVVLAILRFIFGERESTGWLAHFRKTTERMRFLVQKFLMGGKTEAFEVPLILQAIYPFILGCLVLLGFAELSSRMTSFMPGQTFSTMFFPTVYVTSVLGIGIWLYTLFKQKLQFQLNYLVIGLIFGLSFLAYTLWQWRAPYPLNWDLYEHQTLSTLIQQGQYNFSTKEISDTFGFSSYPPTFHLLLALSQNGINLTPETILLYWSVLSFLHLLTVSAASYYFALAVTKNPYVASVGCIIGTLVFESVIAFTNFFILPQTVTATVWVLLVSRMMFSFHKNKPISIIEVVLSAIGLILMHYIIGSLAVALYLGCYIFLRFQNTLLQPKVLKSLWMVVLLACLVGIAVSLLLDLSFLNKGEAALYTFPLDEKLRYLRQFYGLTFLIAPVGFWYFWKLRERSMSQLLLFMLIPLVALLISNFPYVFKFLTLARFPLHVLMAGGLWYLYHNNQLRKFLIGFTVIWFAVILAGNSNQWQQHLLTNGKTTHLSQDDLEAAKFLQNTYTNTSTLIISDPSTAYLLEGLSGINSAGGAFAAEDTRTIFKEAGIQAFAPSTLENLTATFDPVTGIPDKYLLVVSGRSFRWLIADEKSQLSFDYNIWRPEPLSGYNRYVLQALKTNTPSIKEVYKNDSLVIFEL